MMQEILRLVGIFLIGVVAFVTIRAIIATLGDTHD